MPFVRSSDAASGMLTSVELPLNCSAPPYLPAVDQVPFWMVPLLLLPDESPILAPVPSSNEYCATRPLAAAFELGAVAPMSKTRSASAATAHVRAAALVQLRSIPRFSFAES